MSNKPVIRSIREIDIAHKAVFLRLDLNVPLSAPTATGTQVTDDTRIREALPTIQYAIDQGAKVVIGSHLGRPDGKRHPHLSLLPVAEHLANLLSEVDVTLADDCVGEGIQLMIRSLKSGQILMLENLRFHSEEEKNDSRFAHALAGMVEVYITDAFGTSHRKHASTYGVPALMEKRGMGFLIEKELKYLDPLLHGPKKPFYTVLGGAKVSDKIKTIEALLQRIDGLVVGGAMAYAFLAARGDQVPARAKQPSETDIQCARTILREAAKKEIPVLLPSDSVDEQDIGPKTVDAFSKFLSKAGTIFWNGPLGRFEMPEFSHGTHEIARRIGELNAIKVIGGGDTVAAIHQSGAAERFDHLSTGGGAVLEYLEGRGLPGIDILKYDPKRPGSPMLKMDPPPEEEEVE